MRPRVEQVGDALGMLDPQSQTFEPFYTKAQPFEAYARAQGLAPGTAEYAQAVENYRLGGWSAPALENRTELEGVRAGDRMGLETYRAAARLRETRERLGVSRENNIRSTGTSRENSIRSTGTSRSNSIRSSETSRANAGLRDTTTRRGQDLRAQTAGKRAAGRTVVPSEPMARDASGRPMVVRDGKWIVVPQ